MYVHPPVFKSLRIFLASHVLPLFALLMYMIAIIAFVALALVSFMLKGGDSEEEDDTIAAAGDVYFTRMSTTEWFAQRYVPCALDATIVESIPIVKFASNVSTAMASPRSSACAVCLNHFQEEEELKVLPPCRHAFHPSCIDPWFETNSTCPICRAEVTHPSSKTWEHKNSPASCEKLVHVPAMEIVVD